MRSGARPGSLSGARRAGGCLRFAAAALVACGAAGCGKGNSLEGSISDEVSLDFSRVSLEHSSSALAVIYLKDGAGGGGADTILKVTANTTGLKLDAPLTIDLTQTVGTAVRGAVSRSVSNDPRHDFPPLVRGSITLDQAPVVGQKLSGSFSVLFGPGGSLGSGRTAFGDFSATLVEAGQ